MAKVAGIQEHIEVINAELAKSPDMQFKVELLKAKSIALLAETQNENTDFKTLKIMNAAERDRFRIDQM